MKLIVLVLAAITANAQPADSRPSFEVASIKLNRACGNGLGRGAGQLRSPGTLHLECVTLQNLIQIAYVGFANGVALNAAAMQISGGAGWINSEYYDINGKAQGAAPTTQMAGPMLQTLLEYRFKLKLHREMKEVPVFALTVAKSGPRLQRTKEGSCIVLDFNHPPPEPTPGREPPVVCGPQRGEGSGASITMVAIGMTVADWAKSIIGKLVGRPIVDKTGLDGLFDFHLEFDPRSTSAALSADDAGLSIFAALEQQLGLKLEPARGTSETIVIDHVERPSEN